MRRLSLILLIALGLLVFLVISALLARVLSVPGAERAAITTLLQAEARGDAAAMIARITDCGKSRACRQRAGADASSLRRAGSVAILELGPSAGFSLGATVGTSRVAWRAGTALPVVQCVRVKRSGNALSGLRVEILEISRRIRTDADCPARY